MTFHTTRSQRKASLVPFLEQPKLPRCSVTGKPILIWVRIRPIKLLSQTKWQAGNRPGFRPGLGRIFPNSSTPLTAHYTEIGKVFETLERKRQMKIIVLIARVLLGLVFVVLGLNGFLNFLSMGPMPSGFAGQFIIALAASHYLWVIAGLQVVGGVLLLVNRFVPLALVLLGPVIVNILLYHVFLNPSGAALAIVVAILWLIVFYAHRQYFSGIFVRRT